MNVILESFEKLALYKMLSTIYRQDNPLLGPTSWYTTIVNIYSHLYETLVAVCQSCHNCPPSSSRVDAILEVTKTFSDKSHHLSPNTTTSVNQVHTDGLPKAIINMPVYKEKAKPQNMTKFAKTNLARTQIF